MWDITAGKVLKAFQEHQGPVHAIEYHPRELLLASAGADRSIVFLFYIIYQMIRKYFSLDE